MTGQEFTQRRKDLNHCIASASKALGISTRTLCRWQQLDVLPKRIELLVGKLRKRK